MKARNEPDVVVYEDGAEHQIQPAPPRKKAGWGRRIGLGLVWLLALLVIGVVIYAALLIYNVVGISTKPLDFSSLAADANGRTNILILGEGDPGHAGENLTDTMLVVSFNRASKQYAEISVPRDLRVEIPGHGEGKINSANAAGGVGLAEATVSQTLGIPIHYYVQTNFSGLKDMVDAVGGLDVDVKAALIDPDYPCDDNQYKACGLHINAGLQHMDGATVLRYTRCRKGTCGNDFGRAERQQEVIGLLKAKVVRWDLLWHPNQLLSLVHAVNNAAQTDIGPIQMGYLGLAWKQTEGHDPIRLVLSTGNGGYLRSSGDSSDLVPAAGDFSAIQDRVENIFTEPTRPGDIPKS